MPSLSPRLEIDLRRIQDNYVDLGTEANGVEVSAVLKADAYGLGMDKVAPALAEVGCQTFFVAHTEEAIGLRADLPRATIYVLSGPEIELFATYQTLKLRPVLNTLLQLRHWQAFARLRETEPAALHVETGFHRLALPFDAVQESAESVRTHQLKIGLVMSHLACAEDPNHPMNEVQLDCFEEIKKLFPNIPASLSASHGFFLANPAFKQNLVRIGRALYGLRSPQDNHFLTQPSVLISAPVVAIQQITTGEKVGYASSWIASGPRRLATLSIGYADGIPRALQEQGKIYFADGKHLYAAPIAGRISMDLLTCDVSDVPESCVHEGVYGFLATKDHDLMQLGEAAQTIDYEILTHLGARFERTYHT